jgi:hypothetical protein
MQESQYVVEEETHNNIKSWGRSCIKKPTNNKMKQDKDDEKLIHTKTNVERIEISISWVHQCIVMH